jgi:hypothetical protein
MNLAIAFVEVLRDFGIEHKILSVTCDNASNNETMSTELAHKLTKISPVNRTNCFAHILNLVAKSLLKQFDVKQDDKTKDDLTDDEQTLLDLAGDIEQEECTTAQEKDDADDETEDEDDLDGWVDELEALTLDEWEDLEESIRPVKRMLVKVKKICKVFTCMS